MFNAMAQMTATNSGVGMLDFIQANAVAFVANCMNGHLEIRGNGFVEQMTQLLAAGEQKASVTGSVRVGLYHGCAAAAERTVGINLNTSYRVIVVSVNSLASGQGLLYVGIGGRQHAVDTYLHIALVGYLAVEFVFSGAHTSIMGRGDAET